jgi:hypothetical protein
MEKTKISALQENELPIGKDSHIYIALRLLPLSLSLPDPRAGAVLAFVIHANFHIVLTTVTAQ